MEYCKDLRLLFKRKKKGLDERNCALQIYIESKYEVDYISNDDGVTHCGFIYLFSRKPLH